MNYLKLVLVIAAGGFAVWRMFAGDGIDRPPGVLAPDAPRQVVMERAQQISFGNYRLQTRAHYDIEARVLSVERYRTDAGAGLSPIDFAVGWGAMSDSATLSHFRVKQGARFFTIYPDDGALDLATALRSSANMHLIPADDSVRETLLTTRAGNIVALHGYLVYANRDDGFTWNSSLTREDTGAGACELMYVESVTRR